MTITLAFIGWIYLLFLNNRALKRAEIGRLKDDIIKQLLDSSEWLIEETKEFAKIDAKKGKINNLLAAARNIHHTEALECEQIWTAKITQIELKSNLLNKLAKCQLIDFETINSLRDIDFIFSPPSRKEIIELTSDVIENAETKYHENFFDMHMFEALAKRYKPQSLGIIFAFTILILFYHTMDIYIIDRF